MSSNLNNTKKSFLSNKPLFSIHGMGFVFTPNLWSTLLLILFLPLLISLGCWQLNRGDLKKTIQQQLTQRLHQTPLPLAQLDRSVKKSEYYPLRVIGRFDNQHQFLVDNKILNRQPGYYVLTPLIPADSRLPIVMVNRGWIARGKERAVLPALKTVSGVQTVTGIIQYPADKVFLLKQDKHLGAWPMLIQAVQMQTIKNALQKPVYPFVLLMSPHVAHGFKREWKFIRVLPEKHIGYAIQWFALALTLVIIYLVVNIRRTI